MYRAMYDFYFNTLYTRSDTRFDLHDQDSLKQKINKHIILSYNLTTYPVLNGYTYEYKQKSITRYLRGRV